MPAASTGPPPFPTSAMRAKAIDLAEPIEAFGET
jgi:hypothetical protein